MNIVSLILSAVALIVAVIGLIIATKKRENIKEVVKETKVKVEVNDPFTYDDARGMYVLDGNLEVTGAVGALGKEDKV